jgi:glycosyltransferase involved in cell wall biosynthesis
MLKPSLNILQTCFSPSWGGLELQALEVSRLLRDRDHHLWLACCRRSRLEQEATLRGLKVLPYDLTGYIHPRIAWQLSRLIKREKIDIVHCQHSRDIATLVPAMMMARQRAPIVLSKRVGSYISKKDFFHRLTYGHVSRVLAVSEVIRTNVLETTPMTPDRVITLHDAVDTDLFSPDRVDRRRARKEFGFHDDLIVIGFVGRFSPGKGHEDLIEAADILRKRYTNIHFLVVGEASHGEQEYEQTIRARCNALGMQELVTFAGFRKDVPEVMSSFDVFAFPSHAEAFGVVLIEAMAMQRPVVSTNCDGVRDIVVDGETGISVHPRNAGELAGALARLIGDRALREKMGKAGRERVQIFFDQKKQIQKLESVYVELLSNPPSLPQSSVSFNAPPPL